MLPAKQPPPTPPAAAGAEDLRTKFVRAMAQSAATVNVVTTDGTAGRAGVTVSAMAPVSADGDAPTLLVCIHHRSPAAATIAGNNCFCTNVLKDEQTYIADVFAGRKKTDSGDKFACANWRRTPGGSWRAEEPLVAFDCRVKSGERVGTHYVFIGEVADIFIADNGVPLIYTNRAYGTPTRINARARADSKPARFRVGVFHTFGPYLLPAVLRKMQNEIGAFDLHLYEGDQRYLTDLLSAGEIDFAFLYDFETDKNWQKHKIAEIAPYVLLAQDDPLAQCDEISIGELTDKPMVLLDAPPSGDYFMSLFDGIGEPTVAYRTRSFEMARGMVAHGLGYSLLGMKPAGNLSYDGKGLIARPLRENLPTSDLLLCYRRDCRRANGAAHFLRHCHGQFFQHRLDTAQSERL